MPLLGVSFSLNKFLLSNRLFAPRGATSCDSLSSMLRLPAGFCLITQPSRTISEKSQLSYDGSFLCKGKTPQDWNTLSCFADSADYLGNISLGSHACLSVVFSICCTFAMVMVRRRILVFHSKVSPMFTADNTGTSNWICALIHLTSFVVHMII